MGKKRRGAWEDPFVFDGEGTETHLTDWESFLDSEDDETAQEYLAEAHEALSKLYTKTHKRKGGERPPKGARNWQ